MVSTVSHSEFVWSRNDRTGYWKKTRPVFLCQLMCARSHFRLIGRSRVNLLIQRSSKFYWWYFHIMLELLALEMQEKNGGHRLRFRNRACGKIPWFWNISARNSAWSSRFLGKIYWRWVTEVNLSCHISYKWVCCANISKCCRPFHQT